MIETACSSKTDGILQPPRSCYVLKVCTGLVVNLQVSLGISFSLSSAASISKIIQLNLVIFIHSPCGHGELMMFPDSRPLMNTFAPLKLPHQQPSLVPHDSTLIHYSTIISSQGLLAV